MKKPIAVVALGGNALLKKGEKESIAVQIKNANDAVKDILPLIQNFSLVITHGNGPQVGNIVIRVEEALGKAYKLPLDVSVAESEGEIGYILEQAFINQMHKHKIKASVATILTQTLVDSKDRAFKHPTKPIGPFYTKTHVKLFEKHKLPYIFDSGRGYRRVVASPKPIEILEADLIRKILPDNTIIITAGGGGIPVVKKGNSYVGVEAVIDKDLASSCLAKSVSADYFIILTAEDSVYIDYKKPSQKRISKMTVEEAIKYKHQGQFPEGSMGPKIDSAIDFLKNKGKQVIITSPEKLQKALIGKEGTIITK